MIKKALNIIKSKYSKPIVNDDCKDSILIKTIDDAVIVNPHKIGFVFTNKRDNTPTLEIETTDGLYIMTFFEIEHRNKAFNSLARVWVKEDDNE